MKRLIFILVIILLAPAAVVFGQKKSSKGLDTIHKVTTVQLEKMQKKKLMTKAVYTCPMHPEVLQDKPGKCPKCGMNMIKKVATLKIERTKK